MSVAVWRDVSLIWLSLLTLLAIVPITALFFFAIKGMRALRRQAKRLLPLAQEKTRLVADKAEEVSHQVARPFISIDAKAAQVHGVAKAILVRRKNR